MGLLPESLRRQRYDGPFTIHSQCSHRGRIAILDQLFACSSLPRKLRNRILDVLVPWHECGGHRTYDDAYCGADSAESPCFGVFAVRGVLRRMLLHPNRMVVYLRLDPVHTSFDRSQNVFVTH